MNEVAELPHRTERRIAFWLPIILVMIEAVGILFILGNPLKDLENIPLVAGYLLATTLPYLLLALAAHSRSRMLFRGSLIITILVILADLLSLGRSDTCREILWLLFVKANEISGVMILLAVLWVMAWYQKRAK